MSANKLKLGVSACLMGQEVRFNAGHCKNHYITNVLSSFCDFVTVCPETAIGLATPREAIRLEFTPDKSTVLVASKSGTDYTEKMESFARDWSSNLIDHDLDGFILKKDSPSCALFRAKIYQNGQVAERRGTGLFARHLIEAHPDLPMEEEGRLNDPVLREHFLERIFAYRRLKEAFQPGWTTQSIINFHACEKMLLLAHSPEGYRKLGRLVGQIVHIQRDQFVADYMTVFMNTMACKASKGRNANTLQHLSGYFKRQLSPSGRQEVAETIADYHKGLIPLIVPITLLNHLVRRFECTYLRDQTFLNPHPKALMLRNYA